MVPTPPRGITSPLDVLLRTISGRFPLLACATPIDAAQEHARLIEQWSAGKQASPRWTPPALDRAQLAEARRDLERARALLTATRDPWLRLYHDRLVELAEELDVVDGVFGSTVTEHARRRFSVDAPLATRADALAERWLDEVDDGDDEEQIVTDDARDCRSLLSQMRRAVAAAGVGVRIVVRPRVGALAAAGDGVLIVAEGARATAADARRVVLHELEGHVLPRERGRSAQLGLCTLGGAGASEDEEGRALLLEERAGFLSKRRRRTLAARHHAARMVDAGAGFVDVVRALRARIDLEAALAVTARTMRGGYVRNGEVHGGVMRERVYLPAFMRISAAVESDPRLLATLGTARLSLAAHALLETWRGR